mmetsp:Transcript_10960/g.19580  ORF Transcript_10960/g.19580 Transcript_10960/m.19580 type:complete len:93 (+) Transcript_10960:797-1075(+)
MRMRVLCVCVCACTGGTGGVIGSHLLSAHVLQGRAEYPLCFPGPASMQAKDPVGMSYQVTRIRSHIAVYAMLEDAQPPLCMCVLPHVQVRSG